MYNIAGLTVDMEPHYALLKNRASSYLADKSTIPDVIISVSEDFLQRQRQQNINLTMSESEYIWTGSEFYTKLIRLNGFLLHASAVEVDGSAYLFSAPSGTGKSTHTELWLKYFGGRARIINDDKPALRFCKEGIYVYGTPWSGKNDLNINVGVKLGGIAFLARSGANSICKMPSSEALCAILEQTIRPREPNAMDALLSMLDRLIRETNIFCLKCNISTAAVECAYNAMRV